MKTQTTTKSAALLNDFHFTTSFSLALALISQRTPPLRLFLEILTTLPLGNNTLVSLLHGWWSVLKIVQKIVLRSKVSKRHFLHIFLGLLINIHGIVHLLLLNVRLRRLNIIWVLLNVHGLGRDNIIRLVRLDNHGLVDHLEVEKFLESLEFEKFLNFVILRI